MSGNLWMFSDMLDDEDIEMQKHDFITLYQHLRSNNTSGHTGVGLDRRTGKWYAYINFQKKHYNLGLHKDKSAAIRARRAAEARLHDPVILEYWDSLTEKRKKEFQDYLRSTNK